MGNELDLKSPPVPRVLIKICWCFMTVICLPIGVWGQGMRRYGSDESEPIDWIEAPSRTTDAPGSMSYPGLSEMFAYHATTMANTLRTSLIVFSRKVAPPPPHTHTMRKTDVSTGSPVLHACPVR
jgi:hypothetical protein